MNSDSLVKAIQSALTTETGRIVNEEAAAAAKRVEERVKAETVRITTKLLERFNMEMRGPALVITVDFSHAEKPFSRQAMPSDFSFPTH